MKNNILTCAFLLLREISRKSAVTGSPHSRWDDERTSTEDAGFRLLEHPSDLGIEAWGKTLSDAFTQAAVGLSSIIYDPSTVQAREIRTVSLEATDIEQLLVRWLSEVLYLYDGQRFMSRVFDVTLLADTGLTASIRGEALDSGKHQTRLDVKAVTYHQLSVREEEGFWRVVVFLDI